MRVNELVGWDGFDYHISPPAEGRWGRVARSRRRIHKFTTRLASIKPQKSWFFVEISLKFECVRSDIVPGEAVRRGFCKGD
jgi:hypothetical protein